MREKLGEGSHADRFPGSICLVHPLGLAGPGTISFPPRPPVATNSRNAPFGKTTFAYRSNEALIS